MGWTILLERSLSIETLLQGTACEYTLSTDGVLYVFHTTIKIHLCILTPWSRPKGGGGGGRGGG